MEFLARGDFCEIFVSGDGELGPVEEDFTGLDASISSRSCVVDTGDVLLLVLDALVSGL